MPLTAGTKLGPYEIVSVLGAGAMGEVYRARDTRLNRDVAIKVLPPVFARDPERRSRFEREARAVAAINHPNILSVHDIGSADIVDANGRTEPATYMITELLDGDTLRARLADGPLPLRKALDVAMQAARGLAAAHDRGIVHRDLKPENIVLTRDGQVKVLDFGLAKMAAGPAAAASDAQTVAAGTEAGMVMGTVGYMAPEQARGEAADARSDLFALGAVLYELADGRRAFSRATAPETMTAILREDPPPLRPEVAPALDRILRHALEKDPNDRFQSARDFAFALHAASESLTPSSTGSGSIPAMAGAPRGRSLRPREMAAWACAAALALAAAAAWWMRPTPQAASGAPAIFTASLPETGQALASPAVSPDGTRIAFIARDNDADAIWIRRLDAMRAELVKGTTNVRGQNLFWSPDGRSIGFFAGGRLKTVEIATGKIESLADAPSAYGGAWGQDGTIIFNPDERAPLYRVSASGGAATPLTTLDKARGDEAHRWPQFLQDGRHFVFMPWASSTTIRSIQLASLDDPVSKTLFDSPSGVIVAGGYFLYVEDRPSRLLARAFDTDALPAVGKALPVVADDNVAFFWNNGYAGVSAAAGTLVYTTSKFRSSVLTWHNRTGRPISTLGEADAYYDPMLSPDGGRLAVEKRDPDRGSTDLWTVDLARGAFSRLTSTAGFESVPTWSPDGRRIALGTDQIEGEPTLLLKDIATGAEEIIVKGRAYAMDWSRDGNKILYGVDGGATRWDVRLYDVTQKTSSPLLTSEFREWNAKLSPDGKWLAYVSDESRAFQVYIKSFPDGAVRTQVSSEGGNQPQWSRDGTELFFLSADSTLMTATVSPSGPQLSIGTPQPLFATRVDQNDVLRNQYAVSHDGQRILVQVPVGNPGTSPFVAVLNWQAGIGK
jgi:Tol biopolymer transport system component/tRNA A-37 threonylcarbamoyl transferase component Bud32